MPIAVNDKNKGSEHVWNALRQHIIRERQRKKQEREAEVEEERLRKEREAREQQDVMTLGETREQISQLEVKVAQLKEEKHQLFLELKKVLNEDDNRRRLMVKEIHTYTIQALPSACLVHPQLYTSQTVPRSAPVAPQAFKTTNKRTRSPSPPPAVPVSLYHQGYTPYKTQAVPNTSYQPVSQPKDDNRRGHDIVRAVLWNKTAQYSQPGPGTFYTVPPQEVVYYPPITRYEPAPPPRATYHQDAHYPTLRLPLTPAPPPAKSGSITAGYPVRTQTQYQGQPPASLYTASSRPLYQSPGTPMNYPPPRD